MFWTNFFILFSLCCKLATCGSTPAAGNSTTFRSVAYYANYLDRAIYDRKFNPQDLLVDNLTHILYAFANIKPDTREYLSDAWADTDIPFPEDSLSEAGTNIYGCLKQLYLIKKKNRHLKVLLSIGGSSYSANFAALISTVSGRIAFASTTVTLEFPVDHAEAGNITIHIADIDKFSTLASHQANLFRSTSDPATTPFDTQTAIKYYLSQNVSLNKLVLGVPIYSRSFSATNSLRKPFNGVGKDLLLRGAVENYNNASGASYSYDTTTRELINKLGDKSLIKNTVWVLGDLRVVSNQLVYLDSVYDNLRAANATASPANSTGALSSSTSKNDPALPMAGENLGDSVPILYTTITLLAITYYVTSVVIVTG
ncbi:class V chitinase ChiB1 [Leptodontidium sp. MPI-SDFR-AT-0119]|nr:class V chitinase ChiB1 [Leptodontidium sp. MPI-SDFR-AT-0119]